MTIFQACGLVIKEVEAEQSATSQHTSVAFQ